MKRHTLTHERQRTATDTVATVTSAAASASSGCTASAASANHLSSFRSLPPQPLLSRIADRALASFHRGVRRVMSATTHRAKQPKRKKGEGGGADCIFCQLAPGPPLSPPPVASLELAAHTAAVEDVDAAAPAAAPNAPPSPGHRVLFADELVYVVEDHRPAARLHLLVITHAHIRDCDTLDDDKIAAHMQLIGERMLREYGLPGEGQRLGFHVPPCISVPHIHLHVLSGTFRGLCSRQCECCCTASACFAPFDCLRCKYTPCCWWYRSIHAVRRKLRQGHDDGKSQRPMQTMQQRDDGYGSVLPSAPPPQQVMSDL